MMLKWNYIFLLYFLFIISIEVINYENYLYRNIINFEVNKLRGKVIIFYIFRDVNSKCFYK